MNTLPDPGYAVREHYLIAQMKMQAERRADPNNEHVKFYTVALFNDELDLDTPVDLRSQKSKCDICSAMCDKGTPIYQYKNKLIGNTLKPSFCKLCTDMLKAHAVEFNTVCQIFKGNEKDQEIASELHKQLEEIKTGELPERLQERLDSLFMDREHEYQELLRRKTAAGVTVQDATPQGLLTVSQ